MIAVICHYVSSIVSNEISKPISVKLHGNETGMVLCLDFMMPLVSKLAWLGVTCCKPLKSPLLKQEKSHDGCGCDVNP